MWAFLLLLCASHTSYFQKRPLSYTDRFYESRQQPRTFYGYIEYDKNVLVLNCILVGKYSGTNAQKQQIFVTNPQQKVLLDKAEKQQKAVKVVGQVANILGKQVIIIDAVIILDFSSN